jgi:hypothetical protein
MKITHTCLIYNIEYIPRDHTTVIAWSKSSTLLAIGTSRGNVILYDQPTAKYVNKSSSKNN